MTTKPTRISDRALLQAGAEIGRALEAIGTQIDAIRITLDAHAGRLESEHTAVLVDGTDALGAGYSQALDALWSIAHRHPALEKARTYCISPSVIQELREPELQVRSEET